MLLIKSKIDPLQVKNTRTTKKEVKGGFAGTIVVNTVDIDSEHEFTKYYSAHPDKYPEVI